MASNTSSWPSAAAATRANISRSACRTDAELKGARLGLDVASDSSPPPCGEGSGVGVGRCGTSVLHGTTPHPLPPPGGGGGAMLLCPRNAYVPLRPSLATATLL